MPAPAWSRPRSPVSARTRQASSPEAAPQPCSPSRFPRFGFGRCRDAASSCVRRHQPIDRNDPRAAKTANHRLATAARELYNAQSPMDGTESSGSGLHLEPGVEHIPNLAPVTVLELDSEMEREMEMALGSELALEMGSELALEMEMETELGMVME